MSTAPDEVVDHRVPTPAELAGVVKTETACQRRELKLLGIDCPMNVHRPRLTSIDAPQVGIPAES